MSVGLSVLVQKLPELTCEKLRGKENRNCNNYSARKRNTYVTIYPHYVTNGVFFFDFVYHILATYTILLPSMS